MAERADQNAKEIGLVPCRFCGEKNQAWLRRKANNPGQQCTIIQCEGCGAIGPVWNAFELGDNPEYEAAIIAEWNRPTPDAMLAERGKADPLRDAAPDLLAALEEAEITLEQVCEGQHPDNVCCHHLRAARAAIAKAKGGE